MGRSLACPENHAAIFTNEQQHHLRLIWQEGNISQEAQRSIRYPLDI